MKTIAIAQARMGSTRLPGKVMRRLGGSTVLFWTISALYKATGVDSVILATSTDYADNEIAEFASHRGIVCFRGSEDNVLNRYYQCAMKYPADAYLRVTCDCPFLDPNIVGEVIKLREVTGADYCSNVDPPSYPDGLDVECFSFSALEAAWKEATRHSDRDCLTQYIVRNRSRFPAANLTCPIPGLVKERWVLDTEADWEFCKKLVTDHHLEPATGYLKILNIVENNPHLREINNAELGAGRNERFYQQIYTEPLQQRSFQRSSAQLRTALTRIPFAAQTFSKSHLTFGDNGPVFASHGDGARIFDIDGNDYVDLVGALCPIILGYRDPDVDWNVRHQLDLGISLSLATEAEYQLSETLCRLIPCAEMVKLGKNGTDVTSAAIRVARHYTGRNHILVGGYHGWADWSMGLSDRNGGIPASTVVCSHKLKDYIQPGETRWGGIGMEPWEVAAIIIEPDQNPEYLKQLRDICDQYGIVLIFDEVITGFRYNLGGAQKHYDVTPDLATFGKAMANGWPISAVVGRADIMKKFEPPDNIFYSGTFFGDAVAIAAANATIAKLEKENVVPKLWERGMYLELGIDLLTNRYGIRDKITIEKEIPVCRPTLKFANGKVKAYFIQEMARNGVLIINANTLSYAHRDAEMKRVISAYEATFQGIAEGRYSQVEEPKYSAPVRM